MRRIVDMAELGRLWAGEEAPFRDDAFNAFDEDDDYGPIPCDGSVCCPCGTCDAWTRPGEPTRRRGAVSSGDVGPSE